MGFEFEIGSAVYDDLTDADKKLGRKTETAVASVCGRWTGGLLGAQLGALIGGLTGPAAPVTVPILSLALGIAGTFAGDELYKWIIDITYLE